MLTELIYHAIAQPTFAIHGVRKIVQGIYWEEDKLPSLSIIGDLGYSKMKVTRLMNVYYNESEVAAARAKLEERRGEGHSSASILTRNMTKDSRTQGWCIQNVVISTDRKGYATADVFYRSTEVIQKFGADMALLQRIFDEVGFPPSKIRFYFANLYVSAIFFPLLFRFTEPIKLLRFTKRHDPAFHFLVAKTVSRYLDPNNRYSYKAQVKQWNIAQQITDRGKLDEYLMREIGDYHKDHLP